MSRNHFQNILWNLHVSDPDGTNAQKGEANHDPLLLVRPMVDMMQRNFHTKYRPGKELSLDKSICPFKGLLDSVQLLDMGHVYFDNYYNSPNLIDLLYKRKTHACGTVRKNQKSLPSAVTQAKLTKGETVFHCKNNLLAWKWMDKREVYILSGLHKAINVISKKTNYKGQKVTNPQPVFLYNRYMSGVDLTDQFLQYYSFPCKSVKWSKKFFVHCLNMVILNANILHKKYSDSKKCIGSSG